MSEYLDIGAYAGDLNVQQEDEEVAAAEEHPANEGAERVFLFEVYVIQGDDEMEALLIPRELASDHFPPLLNRDTYAEHIQITEPEGLRSDVAVGFLGVESAFMIANDWWKEYVNHNGLKPLDAIQFSRHVLAFPAAPIYHFLVDFVSRAYQQNMIEPEFRTQNLLFQLNFTNRANKGQFLSIPTEEVRHLLPAIGIPSESVGKVRLHFTGAGNNEWPLTITILPTPTTMHHMMTLSDRFVTENNLKVGDLIGFYKPVQPLHSRHFFIKVEKGAGQMFELRQGSGSAAKDGNGDNDGDGTGGGGNRKGDKKGISGRNKRQGDGGSSGGRPKRQKTGSMRKIYGAK